jgi:hypothetical protein
MAPRSPYPLPWCLFLATSVTFFRYATDGAQYPTPVLLLTVVAGDLWALALNPRRVLVRRAGVWLALAVLFHQIVSLLVPFLALAVWLLLRGKNPDRDSISPLLAWEILGLGLGIPVIVYLAVAAIALIPTGEFTPAGLLKYATLYAQEPSYWTSSLLNGFALNLITFVGFYFGHQRAQLLLFSNVWFSLLMMSLPALWLTTLLSLRQVTPEVRWWLGCCALWILPFLVFLSVWVPWAEFYHLFLVVPVACWAIGGAESCRKGDRRRTNVLLFWSLCIVAITLNLPLSLSNSPWAGR